MTPYRLLFVDDDPAVLKGLGDYFLHLGHEVYRAASGREGIALWNRHRPDATVLDLYMPEMDGLAVLEELRSRGAAVIMLTAYGDVPAAVKAMQLGAEGFLQKPIDMAHLTEAIRKAAEKQELSREVRELRARLRPGFRQWVRRTVVTVLLLAAGLWLGLAIGGEREPVRPESAIPVPIDSAPAPQLP